MRFYTGSEIYKRRLLNSQNQQYMIARDTSSKEVLKGDLFHSSFKRTIPQACVQKPIVCHVLYAIQTDLSFIAHCNPASLKIVT